MKEEFNKKFIEEISKLDLIDNNTEIDLIIKRILLELYQNNKDNNINKTEKNIRKLLKYNILELSILLYLLEIVITLKNEILLEKLKEVLIKNMNNNSLNVQINNSNYWTVISYQTVIELFQVIYSNNLSLEIFNKYKNYALFLDKDINFIFTEKSSFVDEIEKLRKKIKTNTILELEYKILIMKNIFKDIITLNEKINHESLSHISLVFFIFTDAISEEISKKEIEIYKEKEKREKAEKEKLQLEKENAEIEVKTTKNILQTITHSLGNSMQEMNNYIDEPTKYKNRLKQSFNLAKSLLLSIKEYNSNNQKFKNFTFFKEDSNDRISISSLFYYVLYNHLDSLFRSDIDAILEGDIDSFLYINSEIKKRIKDIRKNKLFEFIEFKEESIFRFKKYFNSNDFNFIYKYFDINLELLDNLYVKSKNDMTFNIIYVILDELIKNMFKYSSNENKLTINATYTEKFYKVSFINSFKEISKTESGTLSGINLVEMYAKDLGGFTKRIDKKFSVEIFINKQFIKE